MTRYGVVAALAVAGAAVVLPGADVAHAQTVREVFRQVDPSVVVVRTKDVTHPGADSDPSAALR